MSINKKYYLSVTPYTLENTWSCYTMPQQASNL